MIKYINKNRFYFGFCLLIFLFFTNKTFLYSYTIFQNDYKARMSKFGGYCEKYGYGFSNYAINKINFEKNIPIKNYGDYPSLESYFYNIRKENGDEYLILINISSRQLTNEYLKKNYYIVEKVENCYLVSKL